MSDEQDMKDMMEKINQLQTANPNPAGQGMTEPLPINANPMPTNKPGLFDNQGSETDFANTAVKSGNLQQATASPNVNTQNVCPDCNTIHPPIQPGQKCPNSSIEQQTGIKIDDSQVNQFLVQWRNIILSKIAELGIEDWMKEFQQITMDIHRYFDEKRK